MSPKEYRAALDHLGLTIVGAAPVLGLSRRQAQRIAAPDGSVPEPVAKLLRLIIKHEIKPEEVV